MSNKKDLTGKKFGKLTVINIAPPIVSPNGNITTAWHCRCECGKEVDIRTYCLTSGHTKSCGCYRKQRTSETKLDDLTGRRFGRLLVLCRAKENYISEKGCIHPKWECVCDCGNHITVTGNNLRNGHNLSCGCLRKECMAEVGGTKTYNKCKFFKTYVIMYTNKGEEIYIDRCDYTKVKDYCWWITGKGYVLASDKNGGSIQLHRLIMDCPDDLLVDHIGGELTRNDNRRFNLRYATNAENCINKDIRPDNTSGVSGVSWVVSKQKWVASIRIKNETIALGHFTSLEEAAQARKVAEEKYFGEWSYEKSQAIYKAGLAMYADDTIEDTSVCFDANRGYYCKGCVA